MSTNRKSEIHGEMRQDVGGDRADEHLHPCPVPGTHVLCFCVKGCVGVWLCVCVSVCVCV